MTNTEHIVVTASTKMPTTCWGKYGRVAVVEVEKGVRPRMISERARGVVRIVETWEKLNIGKTDRCAFSRARREADEMAAQLNAQQ